MTATLPLLDPSEFAALKSGDEAAYERLFRERYPTLLAAANAEVQDGVRAARVVDEVFLRMWQKRAEFENGVLLEDFLNTAVHDAALREKGRLAKLRRFEEHGGITGKHAATAAPSTDEAWRQIYVVLNAKLIDPETQARARTMAKHAAAEHMSMVGRQKKAPYLFMTGIIALALVLLAVVFWLPARGLDGRISRALAGQQARDIGSAAGERGTMTLDDGTIVSMGAETRIVVPGGFTTQLRVVRLDGTASFKVAKLPDLPFMVRAGRATLTATGTEFDVASYASDGFTVVRVREGSVEARVGKNTRTLGMNESLEIMKDGSMRTPDANTLSETLGWVQGQIVVIDKPLKDVLPILRRWYSLDAKLAEPALGERRVSWNAGIDSTKAAMTAVESSGHIVFDREGKKILLRDVLNKKP